MNNALRVQNIPGWGVDADRDQRPGVPREANSENASSGHIAHWSSLLPQVPKVKIHKTRERPHLTPVFGTACPPKAFSGKIRDFAYARYSEDKLRHWMLLLFADRVDMVESWFSDIASLRVPKIFPKMDFRTVNRIRNGERQAIIATTACVLVVGGLLAYLVLRRGPFRD